MHAKPRVSAGLHLYYPGKNKMSIDIQYCVVPVVASELKICSCIWN